MVIASDCAVRNVVGCTPYLEVLLQSQCVCVCVVYVQQVWQPW